MEKINFDFINTLDIGDKIFQINEINIGLMNRAFKVITNQGSFLIKKLAPFYNNNIDKFIKSAMIAEEFNLHGIPVVCPIRKNNKIIQVINDGNYVIYPWIEGSVLSYPDMGIQHWRELGKLLAKLHKVNITTPGMDKEWNSIRYPKNNFIDNINKIGDNKFQEYIHLIPKLDYFSDKSIDMKGKASGFRISHCDMRPDNLIWTDNHFCLIDWECAGVVVPEIELFAVALVWSGLEEYQFRDSVFRNIINAYEEQNGLIKINKEIGFWSSIADYLWWLDFNLRRYIDNNERIRAEEEINKSFRTIDFLIKNMTILSE